MSVYFVNMESKCTRDGEDSQLIAAKATTRMVRYLLHLRERIESDQGLKLEGFLSVCLDIRERMICTPVERIRALHTLGHDIAHGRLALRSGGFAGDNPYFDDQFSTED